MRRQVRKLRLIYRESVQFHGSATAHHCSECGKEVETLSFVQAGRFLELEQSRFRQLLRNGVLHRLDPDGFTPRICAVSVLCLLSRRSHDDNEPSAPVQP